ncbi:hypothetical protein ACTHPH_06380 [Paenibacillus pasadenensis]|uniref:hypothetical protein n=1 Tax=Paenibacillus TaxID=44249 RepID=UPI00041A19AE|nr:MULTISPECIES: hypothetical protein [Paenibacillus]QGG58401.1 hypothetical protein GE073_24345 [Paenibacillus sp. B01]
MKAASGRIDKQLRLRGELVEWIEAMRESRRPRSWSQADPEEAGHARKKRV